MSQSYIIFETKKHTTTNTLFDSQNGLRVRPNIQVPIYVRVLGLNLCFEILRKFWKGKNYVLGPHGSRLSRYQVMVNYPVFFCWQTRPLAQPPRHQITGYCGHNYPQLSALRPCMLYLYHSSRVIFIISSLACIFVVWGLVNVLGIYTYPRSVISTA